MYNKDEDKKQPSAAARRAYESYLATQRSQRNEQVAPTSRNLSAPYRAEQQATAAQRSTSNEFRTELESRWRATGLKAIDAEHEREVRSNKIDEKFDNWYSKREAEIEAGTKKRAGYTGVLSGIGAFKDDGSVTQNIVGATGKLASLGLQAVTRPLPGNQSESLGYTFDKLWNLDKVTRELEEGLYVALKREGIINEELSAWESTKRYGKLGVGAVQSITSMSASAVYSVADSLLTALAPGKDAYDSVLDIPDPDKKDLKNATAGERAAYLAARFLYTADVQRDNFGTVKEIDFADITASASADYIGEMSRKVEEGGGSDFESKWLYPGIGAIEYVTRPFVAPAVYKSARGTIGKTMEIADAVRNKQAMVRSIEESVTNAGGTITRKEASEIAKASIRTANKVDEAAAQESLATSLLKYLPEDSAEYRAIVNRDTLIAYQKASSYESLVTAARSFNTADEFVNATKLSMTYNRALTLSSANKLFTDIVNNKSYRELVDRANEIITKYADGNTASDALRADTPANIVSEYTTLKNKLLDVEEEFAPLLAQKRLLADDIELGKSPLDYTYPIMDADNASRNIDDVLRQVFETSQKRQASVLENLDDAPKLVGEMSADDIMDQLDGLRTLVVNAQKKSGSTPADLNAYMKYYAQEATVRGFSTKSTMSIGPKATEAVQQALVTESSKLRVKKYDLPASQFVRRVKYTEGDTMITAYDDAMKYKTLKSFIQNSDSVVYRAGDDVTYVRSKDLAKKYADVEGVPQRVPVVVDMKRPMDLRDAGSLEAIIKMYNLNIIPENGTLTPEQARLILSTAGKNTGRDGVIFKHANSSSDARVIDTPRGRIIPASEFFERVKAGETRFKNGMDVLTRRKVETTPLLLNVDDFMQTFDSVIKGSTKWKIKPDVKEEIKRTILMALHEDRADAWFKTAKSVGLRGTDSIRKDVIGYRRIVLDKKGNDTGLRVIITKDEVSVMNNTTKQRVRIVDGKENVDKLINDVVARFKSNVKDKMEYLEKTNDLGAPSATKFRAKGPGHVKYDNDLKTMVANGTISPEDYMLLRAVFFDTADDVLNSSMFRIRPANYLPDRKNPDNFVLGRAYGTAKEFSLPEGYQLQRGLSQLHYSEAWRMADPMMVQPVAASMTALHEFGHTGYAALLTKAQRARVKNIYDEMKANDQLKDFFTSPHGAASGGYGLIKNEREFFAQAFTEYVLQKRVPHAGLVSMFKRIADKVADTIALILRKDGNNRIQELDDMFEQIVKGEASLDSKFMGVDDMGDYRSFRLDRKGSQENLSTRLQRLFSLEIDEKTLLDALEQPTEEGFKRVLMRAINENMDKITASKIMDSGDLDDAFAMARGGKGKKPRKPKGDENTRDVAREDAARLKSELTKKGGKIPTQNKLTPGINNIPRGAFITRETNVRKLIERRAIEDAGVEYIGDKTRLVAAMDAAKKRKSDAHLKVTKYEKQVKSMRADTANEAKGIKNAEERAAVIQQSENRIAKINEKLIEAKLKMSDEAARYEKLKEARNSMIDMEERGYIPPTKVQNQKKIQPQDTPMTPILKELTEGDIADQKKIDALLKLFGNDKKNTPKHIREGQAILLKTMQKAQKEVTAQRAKNAGYLESYRKQLSDVRKFYKDKLLSRKELRTDTQKYLTQFLKEFGLTSDDLYRGNRDTILRRMIKIETTRESNDLAAYIAMSVDRALVRKTVNEMVKLIKRDKDGIAMYEKHLTAYHQDLIDSKIAEFVGTTVGKSIDEDAAIKSDFIKKLKTYKDKANKDDVPEDLTIESMQKSLTKLSANDLLPLVIDINNIYKEGREMRRLIEGYTTKDGRVPGLRELYAEQQVDIMSKAGVFNYDKKGLPKTVKGIPTEDTSLSRMYDGIKTGNVYMMTADRVFDSMDNFDYAGPLRTMIKQPFDDAIDKAEVMYTSAMKRLTDKEEAIFAKFGIELDDKNYTRIGIHAYIKQRNGEKKMLDAGISQKDIDAARVLEPAEASMYTFMREELDMMFPKVDAVFRNNEFMRLKAEKNYFPHSNRLYDDRPVTTVKIGKNDYSRKNVVTDEYHPQKSAQHQFVKIRKDAITTVAEMRIDARQIFQRHMKDATYYVNVEPELQRVANMMRVDKFKSELGELHTDWLTEWIDAAVARRGYPAGYKYGFLDDMVSNIGVSTLGFNPSPIVKQPLAALAALPEIGASNYAKAILDITGVKKKGFLSDWNSMIDEYSIQMKMRSLDDPAFTSLAMRESAPGDGALSKARSMLVRARNQYAYWGIQKMDKATADTVWYAAYRQKMVELGSKFDVEDFMSGTLMSDKNHEAARKWADYVTRKTQGSSKAKDVSMLYNLKDTKGWMKTLFQFRSFVFNQSQIVTHDAIYRSLRNVKGDIKTKMSLAQSAGDIAMRTGWVAAGVAIEDFITVYLTSLYGSSSFEETLKERTAGERIMDIFGGVVVPLGYLMDLASNQGRTGVPLIDSVMQAFNMQDAENAKSEMSNASRNIENALKLMGVPGSGFAGTLFRGQLGLEALYTTPAEHVANSLKNGDTTEAQYLLRKFEAEGLDAQAIYKKAMNQVKSDLEKDRKRDVDNAVKYISGANNAEDTARRIQKIIDEGNLDQLGLDMLERELGTRVRNEQIGEGWKKDDRIDLKQLQ